MCLTEKRKAFVTEYIACRFNATQAAKNVGYKHPNKIGPKLVHEPEIEAEIKRRVSDRILESEQALFLLSKQATASATDFVDEHGIIDFQALIESGIQLEEINHYKGRSGFKLPSQQKALELIGKYHKIFTDKVEHDHQGNIEVSHKVDLSELNDEQLAKLEQLIASITS